jgi:hypothetical protein
MGVQLHFLVPHGQWFLHSNMHNCIFRGKIIRVSFFFTLKCTQLSDARTTRNPSSSFLLRRFFSFCLPGVVCSSIISQSFPLVFLCAWCELLKEREMKSDLCNYYTLDFFSVGGGSNVRSTTMHLFLCCLWMKRKVLNGREHCLHAVQFCKQLGSLKEL